MIMSGMVLMKDELLEAANAAAGDTAARESRADMQKIRMLACRQQRGELRKTIMAPLI